MSAEYLISRGYLRISLNDRRIKTNLADFDCSFLPNETNKSITVRIINDFHAICLPVSEIRETGTHTRYFNESLVYNYRSVSEVRLINVAFASDGANKLESIEFLRGK